MQSAVDDYGDTQQQSDNCDKFGVTRITATMAAKECNDNNNKEKKEDDNLDARETPLGGGGGALPPGLTLFLGVTK